MTHEEFEKLYRTHKNDWAKLAAAFTRRDFEGGEDIVHEVLANIMEKKGLESIDMTSNPESYIRNAICRYIQRFLLCNPATKNRMDFLTGQITDEQWQDVKAPEPEEEAPPDPLIERALESLTPVKHDIVCLKLFAALTFKEVAKAMNLKVGRAETLYYEALKELKLYFESVGISDPSSFLERQTERSHDAY